MVISLSERVALGLQKQANKKGVSQSDLVVALLDTIARDNLYEAVIDAGDEPKKLKPSRAPRRSKTEPK
jgi:hypothetical protein